MSDNQHWGSNHQPGPYGQPHQGGQYPQGPPQYPPHAPSGNQPGPYGQPGPGPQPPYGQPQGYGQPMGQPGGYGYPPQQNNSKTWWIVGAIAIIAIIIGIVLFLVLGGDDEDSTSDARQTSQTEPAGGTTPGPGGSTPGSDSRGDRTAGKPSYNEVVDGMRVLLDEQLAMEGVSPADLELIGVDMEAYYTCVADGIYNSLSVPALWSVADGDPSAPVFGNDHTILTEVADSCLDEIL